LQFWLRISGAIALFALAVLWGEIVWLTTRSAARVRQAVTAVFAGPVCRVLGLDVRMHDAHRLDGPGARVVIANHQSIACHMVLSNVYRRLPDCVVLGKLSGKWNIPVVAGLFQRTGNIIVDPRRPYLNGRGLHQALAALRAGKCLGMYPEGTRGKDTRRLGPFQRGAFVLAIDAGVPIVPVVVSRFKPRMDPDARRMLPQVTDVRVLEPIPTTGLTRADVPRLRDLAASRMQAVLDADEAERARAEGRPGSGRKIPTGR
jgi:1-acyl-sn-glycerol-3-phosphate acyltransferase